MSGWLAGKRVCLAGGDADLSAALTEAGAQFCDNIADADVLIHCAAAGPADPAHLIDHAAWRATMDAGLDQRFHAAAALAAACREQDRIGSILYLGAPEQRRGAAQAAAAGALGNLVKTLAVEWARDGIRVNALLTSATGTAVARFAAWLASDYAAYVTGAVTGWSLDDD